LNQPQEPGAPRRGHVLLVFDTIYPFGHGGAGLRLYYIGRGLVRRGWRVTWVGGRSWDGPAEQRVDGMTILGIGRFPDSRTRDGTRRSPASALSFCAALAFARLPNDIDCIILGQTPWLHYFVLRLRTLWRVPIVVDCWEIWGRFWREYYGRGVGTLGSLVERSVLHGADRLVAISGMTFERVVATGVARGKIVLAPNGVDRDAVASAVPHASASDVVYLGRLVAHKNVDVLMRAMALVRRRYPGVRLVIIGDGPSAPQLADLRERLDLSANVRLLGAIQSHVEAMSHLKASKIFVQPSTSEGGGSAAVLEANACGLPVIAVRHPQGIDPALIVEGSNGCWIGELSPERLSERIVGLLEDPQRLASLSAGARAAANDSDWEKAGGIYHAVLCALATAHMNA
jgi:glycosyltransferase involved in cell wall biosynthesis